ncbi:DNA polymerase [Phanerochaete sordida]|uniref:DNA polymerase n=1 Tax=Phanerochaete sordida TaxID=48140 RepID=A0A9P3GNY6_9APHY|nr:DNA polymerase [Phanerochaete sordida]
MLARPLALLRVARPAISVRFYTASSSEYRFPRPWKKSYPAVQPDNQAIVDALVEHRKSEYFSERHSQSKLKALTSAINLLSKYPHAITTLADVATVPKLHTLARNLIVPLLSVTGQHRSSAPQEEIREQLQESQEQLDVYQKYANRFAVVHGLGERTVAELIRAGCTSVEQLVNDPKYLDMLGPLQRNNALWAVHSVHPVTRPHVEVMVEFMRETLGSAWEVIPTGEYRRGLEEFSEASFVFCHPTLMAIPLPDIPVKAQAARGVVSAKAGVSQKCWHDSDKKASSDYVLKPLQDRGVLADIISKGPGYWRGMALIPAKDANGRWDTRLKRSQAIEKREGTFRKVRIQFASTKSRGAALLWTTGDVGYLRHLAIIASKQNLLFNAWGLWRFRPSADEDGAEVSSKVAMKGHWELLPSETEEQILQELGEEWIEPERRNFLNI